jgi:hypothetical protein
LPFLEGLGGECQTTRLIGMALLSCFREIHMVERDRRRNRMRLAAAGVAYDCRPRPPGGSGMRRFVIGSRSGVAVKRRSGLFHQEFDGNVDAASRRRIFCLTISRIGKGCTIEVSGYELRSNI